MRSVLEYSLYFVEFCCWETRGVEFVDGVLNVSQMLVKQAYRGIQLTKDLEEGSTKIPAMQESAILLLEKVINKAPTSLVMQWIQHLHKVILLWLADSGNAIRDLPKQTRQAYQARLETLWNDCILHRLQSCGEENKENGAKSGFGSVMAPPSTTIRGAYDRAQATQGAGVGSGSKSAAGAGLLSRSSSSTSLSSGTRGKAAVGPFSSEELARLSPLLVAALVSGRKAVVNKTLEFWNETFGLSQTDLVYPEAFVEAMRPLRLVATVKLPGWSYEDSSQTEAPQFLASMSQEALLSIPAELNVRVSASKLMKQKAELVVSSSSPASSPKKDAAVTPSPAKNRSRRAHVLSEELGDVYVFEEEKEDREDKTPTRRKRSKIVHTLEMDPVNKSLVGKSSEQTRRSFSPDGAGSWDEAEVSTPTKQPVQRALGLSRKAQRTILPAPPVWRLEPPLQPYDPARDDLSATTPTLPSSPGIPDVATPATAALGSGSIPPQGSVDTLSEDHGYANVSSTGSGGSTVISPQIATQMSVLGNDSELTTMDMSQQHDQEGEPMEITNMDVLVDGNRGPPVEDSAEPIVEDAKETIMEDSKEPNEEDSTEPIVEDPKELTVETSSEAIVEDPMESIAQSLSEAAVEETPEGNLETPAEIVVVENPVKAIAVKTPVKPIVLETPKEIIAMGILGEAIVEKKAVDEPGVDREEITIEGSQSILMAEADEDRSLSVLSQQSASNESKNLTESKSPEQHQEREIKVQGEVKDVVVEVKRRRGRPPNSSYASSAFSVRSASSSQSASSSPENKVERRSKKVLKRSPMTTAPTSASASVSVLVSPVSVSPVSVSSVLASSVLASSVSAPASSMSALVSSVSPSARNLTGTSDESRQENVASEGGNAGALTAVANEPSPEQIGPIEDCTEFMTALRRVEEASGLLGKLDSR